MKVAIISYPIFKERYQLQDSGRLLRIYGLLRDDYDVDFLTLDSFLMKNVNLMDKFFHNIKFNLESDLILENIGYIFDSFFLDSPIINYDLIILFPREENLFVLLLDYIHNKLNLDQQDPKTKIALTNIDKKHALELLKHKKIDYFIKDKSQEYKFKDIAYYLDNNSHFNEINGLIFQKDGKIIETTDDSLDLNYYKTTKIHYDKNYFDSLRLYSSNFEIVNNIFSENHIFYRFSYGCSRMCAYCAASTLSNVYKSPKQILSEIKEIVSVTGSKYIMIDDPNIAINKNFITELCNLFISDKLEVFWISEIFPSKYLDNEIFYKMRKSGCILLMFGVESGSDRLLQFVERTTTVAETQKSLVNASENNIMAYAHLISGLPSETNEDFNATLNFLENNKNYIDFYNANRFWLDKNSRICDNPEKYYIDTNSDNSGNFDYLDSNGQIIQNSEDTINQRMNILNSKSNRPNYNKYFIQFYDKLIYPLFDYLKTRKKVNEFLNNNQDILFKTNGYFSVSLGLVSNQNEPGSSQSNLNDEFKFISFDYFKETVDSYFSDKFTSHGFHSIVLVGKEPLIHPNILKFLKYAKSKKPRNIIIKTNARMLSNLDFCTKISKLCDEILVVDFANNENDYESISKVKGSWEQSRKGIENWKSLGKKLNHWYPD